MVIPAYAGIQGRKVRAVALDPRFRGGDEYYIGRTLSPTENA